jgi:hypothetical protein
MEMLSRRHSHPRLRHFLSDFGKCRFILLLFCFSLTHDIGLWIGVDKNVGSIQRNSKNLNFSALYPPPIF